MRCIPLAVLAASLPAQAQSCNSLLIETLLLPDPSIALAAGDLNDDGFDDAVTLNQLGQISRYLSNGSTGSSGPITPPQLFGPTSSGDVVIADVNNDTYPDIIAASMGARQICVMLNNRMGGPGGGGPGSFSAPVFYSTLSGVYEFGPSELAVGDFNDDGLPDIAIAGLDSLGLGIFPGTGAGAFGPIELIDDLQPVFNANIISPNDIVTGVGPMGETALLAIGESTATGLTTIGEVVYNDATGIFEYHELLNEGSDFELVRQLTGADLNDDGVTDLIMRETLGGFTTVSTFKVYLRQTSAPFGFQLVETGTAAPQFQNVGTGGPNGSYDSVFEDVSVIDLDGDGNLDLLFPGVTTTVSFGEGLDWPDATPFDASVVTSSSVALALGDWDGDSDFEVITIDPIVELQLRFLDCDQGAPDPVVINEGPLPALTAAGGVVSTSVDADGSDLQYQWRRDGVDLTDDARISGANGPALSISPFMLTDTGIYDVVVSNAISSETSASTILAARQTCPGDVNNDGLLSPSDFTAWLTSFNAGCP